MSEPIREQETISAQPSPDPAQPQRTRAEINRENASKSTGPRTPAGKASSRLNGFRHGLCAQSIVLRPEDHQALMKFSNGLVNSLRPRGDAERVLVESMAGSYFQGERARAIENNILQYGAMEHCNPDVSDADFDIEHTLGVMNAFKENCKTLDLLSRYQTRHHRQFLLAHARLLEIQRERRTTDYASIRESKKHHQQAFAKHQQAAATGFARQKSSTGLPACDSSAPRPQQGNFQPKTVEQIAAGYLKNNKSQAA